MFLPQALKKLTHQFQKKGFRFAFKAAHWKLRTALFKRWLRLQDTLKWYTYADWIRENEENHHPAHPAGQPGNQKNNPSAITFAWIIRMPVLNDACLEVTLKSLQAQTHPHWRAIVCFPANNTFSLPAGYDDGRIAAIFDENCGLLAKTLDHVVGDWVGLLDCGDTLSACALAVLAETITANPEADVVYSDQDSLAEDNHTRHSPLFWPDWSPELLYSVNFLSRAVARRQSLLAQEQTSASLEETIIHCARQCGSAAHIPQVLFHLRSGQVPQVNHHSLPEPDHGLVSIIVLSSDRVDYLRRCLQSLLAVTANSHYEIIVVENNSRQPETFAYYDEIKQDPRVRIVVHNHSFNFSEFNNLGASLAQGEFLLFLNNDTEVIEPGWLDEMTRWAAQPEIGVVGAKLLYPNGLIQHAGVIVGLEGHAHHIFAGYKEGYNSIFGSDHWYRNYSAVTAACLMMRKEVFDQIGGFDGRYRIAFGDIELCLRAGKAGYRVLYTPFARLVHNEGGTRANYIPPEDIRSANVHFQPFVQKGDPYFNPNLSYALHLPTYHRRGEETPGDRLNHILEYLD